MFAKMISSGSGGITPDGYCKTIGPEPVNGPCVYIGEMPIGGSCGSGLDPVGGTCYSGGAIPF